MIVTAFQGRLAAETPIVQDVPVPGGTAALAAALGIDPVPDRARFVSELTRLLFDIPEGRNAATNQRHHKLRMALASAPTGAERRSSGTADRVPVPLTAAIWSDAVFHHPIADDGLLAAILGDRQAALLCHGLAGLDDPTLRFFAGRPGLIAELYQHSAPAFASFGSHLSLRDGAVAAAGGPEAAPLWEATLGERVQEPERFVRALYQHGGGRVAYLYDTIAQIEPRQAAFALGLWIRDPRLRVRRFTALIDAIVSANHEWHVRDLPFTRPLNDAAMLFPRVQTDDTGRPLAGSWKLWSAVFDAAPPDAAGGGLDAVDAAWLADVVINRDSKARADRVDQFAFGQRAFGDAAPEALAHVAEAIGEFPRSRMLMLTLERMGIRDPAVYAAAARRARTFSAVAPVPGFLALAQFQGALALLDRMVRARSLDARDAERLVLALLNVRLDEHGRFAGGIADWINHDLRSALAAADDAESTLLGALGGRQISEGTLVPVAWEGQQYRLDLVTAEIQRLVRVRLRQGGPRLDWAIDVLKAARDASRPGATVADIRAAGETLARVADALSSTVDREGAPGAAGGSARTRDTLRRVATRLSKIQKDRDARTAAKIVVSCADAADRLLADALLSLAYAVYLGDPEGTVLLAGNVALRHDFGFAAKDRGARDRSVWSVPRVVVSPGVAWHVTGSLLGLDIGLAQLALRRVNAERPMAAPTLTSNERESFAISVALMNPFMLTDADRDAIGSALARGRARVAALTADTLDAVADEIGMDGWRRRAARWIATAGGPPGEDLRALFSMTELLELGRDVVEGSTPQTVHAWGMGALASMGCICTRLVPSRQWTLWTGRPQQGVLSAAVADLNLVVAETLYQLKLPAALARDVLAAAVQDFIDEVRPTDPDDWLTLARTAQRVSRERIEDYVAAAAAGGPLLPVAGAGTSR
jgi:hypothetical protein